MRRKHWSEYDDSKAKILYGTHQFGIGSYVQFPDGREEWWIDRVDCTSEEIEKYKRYLIDNGWTEELSELEKPIEGLKVEEYIIVDPYLYEEVDQVIVAAGSVFETSITRAVSSYSNSQDKFYCALIEEIIQLKKRIEELEKGK